MLKSKFFKKNSNSNASQIAHLMVKEMGADNNTVFKPTSEQLDKLTSYIKEMLDDGCVFDSNAISLVTSGDQDEAEASFSKYKGYQQMSDALADIFEGESYPDSN